MSPFYGTLTSMIPKKNSTVLQKLDTHYQTVRDSLFSKHSHAKNWFEKKSLDLSEIRLKSQQLLAAASIVGGMAVSPPVEALVQDQLNSAYRDQLSDGKSLAELTAVEHQAILDKMKEYVVRPPGHLLEQEELYLEQQLTDMLGFPVTAELEGNRLNHSIGIMGGEQHLQRFPGDTLDQHDAYREAGIAPARGAFGWFTENGVLTDAAIQREKYYFAVQTLYLPNWNTDHPTLKPWYKFRKMVAINPAEEIAVVGVVGDAGPAKWVNKQFGGSPEIIREAKIWSSQSRGRVILFFVDDPDNSIPLGVIPLGLESLQK